MKNNRLIPLFALLFSCVLLFSACAGNTDTTEAPTTADKSSASSSAQEAVTVTETAAVTTEADTSLTEAATGEEIHISIEAVFADGSSKIFPLTTRALNLADALTGSGIAEGKNEQYGFTIYTVDGVTVDFTVENAYWAISVNGKAAETGASSIILENSGVYTLTYTVY